MLEIKFTAKFKRDLKKAKKQGKDLSKLHEALGLLAAHSLTKSDFEECAPWGTPNSAHAPSRQTRTIAKEKGTEVPSG